MQRPFYSPVDDLQPLVCDFETYWDTDTSLGKMSVDEYVPKAMPIMATINHVDGKSTEAYVGMASMRIFFNAVDWSRTIFVAHNCAFDAAVLKHWFGHVPYRFFCTMQGARPHMVPFSKSMGLAKLAIWLSLEVKKGNFASHHARGKHLEDFTDAELRDYIVYGVDDTNICTDLYHRIAGQLNDHEQLMLHATIAKSINQRLVLDRSLVGPALIAEKGRKQLLFQQTGIDKEDIMSNPKFAKVLENLGVSPPMKLSPTTNKPTYAFAKKDKDFLALLTHQNPKVVMAVECRINGKSTIEETRLTRFLSITEHKATIPFPLMYYGAHTGRLSGADKLNMQNLTKGTALRRAVCAPEGFTIVVSDLSQIEARIVAWLADVGVMLNAFADPDRDVYCEFGTSLMMWGQVTKDMKPERFVSKTGVLSLMYGVGKDRFYDAINTSGMATITSKQADTIVHGYRKTYKSIPKLWSKLEDFIRAMVQGQSTNWRGLRFVGYGECTMYGGAPVILLPQGRRLYFPNLKVDRNGDISYDGGRGIKHLWGGAILENIAQALAQIIIRNIELRMIHKLKFHETGFAVGQAHDELIYCVPTHNAPKFAQVLHGTMTENSPWNEGLPLECETEMGANYADAK